MFTESPLALLRREILPHRHVRETGREILHGVFVSPNQHHSFRTRIQTNLQARPHHLGKVTLSQCEWDHLSPSPITTVPLLSRLDANSPEIRRRSRPSTDRRGRSKLSQQPTLSTILDHAFTPKHLPRASHSPIGPFATSLSPKDQSIHLQQIDGEKGFALQKELKGIESTHGWDETQCFRRHISLSYQGNMKRTSPQDPSFR